MKLLTLIATCIHICIEINNVVLKRLLFDFAKKKIKQERIIFLYIKIASIDKNTEFYKIMNEWVVTHQSKIIHQLLYTNL
jgi:hypothetical protein